jgi:hypothetical protein
MKDIVSDRVVAEGSENTNTAADVLAGKTGQQSSSCASSSSESPSVNAVRQGQNVEQPTTLKILNIRDRWINGSSNDDRDEQNRENASTKSKKSPSSADAIRFEVINIDNSSVERHPKIPLNVIELRVALAMRFLDFVEVNDRL